VERRLAKDGFVRRRGETAHELADRAGHAPWAGVYYLARFGARPLTANELAEMERVRKEL
jgi:hypothetical protein